MGQLQSMARDEDYQYTLIWAIIRNMTNHARCTRVICTMFWLFSPSYTRISYIYLTLQFTWFSNYRLQGTLNFLFECICAWSIWDWVGSRLWHWLAVGNEKGLIAPCFVEEILETRTVFKKTGRKSGRNKHNTRFYISVSGNSLQDQSRDQQSIT